MTRPSRRLPSRHSTAAPRHAGLGLCLGVSMALGLAACQGSGSGRAEVSQADHHDLSAPLLLMPVAERQPGLVEHEVKRLPRATRGAPAPQPLRAAAAPGPLAAMPAPLASFDGVGQGFSGPAGTFSVNSAPPDTNGDVGPNHYVQIVNTDFAIFNKSGTPLFGPVPANTLWSGFGGFCQTSNDGDPVVLYDPIADRWVISQFQVTSQPFQQCVAVSQTADPTGAWYRYAFSYSAFPDYPKMGVWPDAYYITFNMFNAAGTAYLGAKACAYDRASMLVGAAATQQCFDTGTTFGGLLPADLDGSLPPPAGAPNPMLALGATATTLAFWQFHVDWASPASSTFTGPTTLNVPGYTEACGASGTCIPQSGGGSLDSLSDRLMFRLAYRNFADGHQSLVTNHSVTVGSSVGVRWYEVRLDPANDPSVFQSGTYAPDANFRWMGSIAQDQAGNLALGFSTSSSSLKPSIRYTGRLAGDPAGTMSQGENTLVTGLGAQGSSLTRWGDYSMMAVDPTDDCTFWYTTEYIPANGTFNWKTRIGSFKFPGCGAAAVNDFSIGASPATLTLRPGASGSVTVSTAVVSGTAEAVSLSVSGLPAGATASFSPASVAAGGSSTLTVDTGTAAPGTSTLTITGTAPSATHSATLALTVNGAPDFTVAVSPASATVAAGGSAAYTVSTSAVNGSTQTVALEVSGLPAGVTGSFSPAAVTAGGASTLTVSAAASAPASVSTLTVTGTSGASSHSASASLTVTASSGATPLVNGVPVTGISGARGSQRYWVLDVPAGQATLTFTIAGGTGDADLYVRQGALPTTASYACRPYLFGNNETCTFSAPAAGAWYVMIRGFTAYSGVTLTGGYGPDTTTALANGVPVPGISGATGSQKFWKLAVPAGQASVVFSISGGTGDADLYVRSAAKPTITAYNCRPFLVGNNETCSFTAPAAGDWYVMLRGYTAYSGVTLVGHYP